jgi:L-fuculose-phosphate aldolase
MPDTDVEKFLPQFQRAGSVLLACRCNNSHSGNLSVRSAERIIITRTGAMLGYLQANDLVSTNREPSDDERDRASTELPVHLGIYAAAKHEAIAHGHALAATAVGWLADRINPVDVEGAYYFGHIPVVEHNPATAVPELGEALGAVLADHPVVVLRGHGVFAVGESLEQAAQRITSVNDSAELIIKARHLGLDSDELARAPYLDFGLLRR